MKTAVVGMQLVCFLLFFFRTRADEGIVDLTLVEDQFLMDVVHKMDDSNNPKEWRKAEEQFKSKLESEAEGFKEPRSAYSLARYANFFDHVRIPEYIFADLASDRDLADDYVYINPVPLYGVSKTVSDAAQHGVKLAQQSLISAVKSVVNMSKRAGKSLEAISKTAGKSQNNLQSGQRKSCKSKKSEEGEQDELSDKTD